ncbi:hypothetical protein O3P69_008056 [Scylla paramamosain]|uniref:Uncharacterized protein n=1 Tax=Scylla paramamosain TaxID=85552 RepID=A0AAW0T0B6_SCYPA
MSLGPGRNENRSYHSIVLRCGSEGGDSEGRSGTLGPPPPFLNYQLRCQLPLHRRFLPLVDEFSICVEMGDH